MNTPSSRRYLSVWLRRLSTDRIERRLSAPADAPRVIVAAIENAQRIVALNDAAAQLGLKSGMPLADARARYPALSVAEVDFEADRRLLEAIADWCDRYTPLVGLDPPDGLVLDITGCAHLFGGEMAMARDLIARLARQGFAARAAVADTVGGAWGFARHGDFSPVIPGRAPLAREPGNQKQPPCLHLDSASRADARVRNDGEFCIIPRGETEAAVLLLPIASLRVEAEIVAGLAALGLKRVVDLRIRPRAPLVARFGEMLLRRLDQALGWDEEPITPRLPVPAAMAEQRFPEPIAMESDVLGTIEQLARRLACVLERRGEGARLIQTALFRADGKVHRLEIGTGAPLREPAHVRRLFEDRLAVLGDACDPGFGYDMVRLSALVTERSDPGQTGFASPAHAEELTHLIDRLGARFGLRRVTRLMPQDTHIPEFAVVAMPAHAVRQMPPPPSVLEQDSLGTVRPIRLLPKPQPILVLDEVPDGPPARFRWKQTGGEWLAAWQREWQKIVVSEGPERIAMEWWRNDRGQKLERDYFRIESQAGARFWIYREALYQSDKSRPRWYLHGFLP
jgi:protein ImuB